MKRKITLKAEIVSVTRGYEENVAVFSTDEGLLEFIVSNDDYAKLKSGMKGMLTYDNKFKEFIKFK